MAVLSSGHRGHPAGRDEARVGDGSLLGVLGLPHLHRRGVQLRLRYESFLKSVFLGVCLSRAWCRLTRPGQI